MQDLRFPEGFLWGTATSSHQVEGGNVNNQWWQWEQMARTIWHGDKSGRACKWWAGMAEEDFDRAAELGQNTLRLSLEWSRIEPLEGEFSDTALARYREMLMALHQRGLKPMVTLHHFTNPLWLENKGGWENRAVAKYFARYTHRVVEELGDLVPLWCTINEPGVYAVLSYLQGVFPPGVKNIARMFNVIGNMLRGHAAAYRAIHSLNGNAKVGLVKNIRFFDAANPVSPLDRLLEKLHNYAFNDIMLDAVRDGILRFPLSLGLTAHGALIDSTDFIGVNYYTRDRVAFDLSKPTEFFTRRFFTPNAEMSDRGRDENYGEIYPEGLYRALKMAATLNKPLYVTETGLPDADDDQRPRFIITHLAEVHRAIREGLPIKGFYHWSLVDNFEWAQGWDLRFGLYQLDQKTQERTLRDSGRLYKRIAEANAITHDMVEQYAPEIL